jgi:hypothetical protein
MALSNSATAPSTCRTSLAVGVIVDEGLWAVGGDQLNAALLEHGVVLSALNLRAAIPPGPGRTILALTIPSPSRCEIIFRSAWATTAMIPTVSSFASGMSAATNRRPGFCSSFGW